MNIQKRSTVDSDGAMIHLIHIDSPHVDVDMVKIILTPNEDIPIRCECYENNEIVHTSGFKKRNLSFEPLSPIGVGERSNMIGISQTSNRSDDEYAHDVELAFNSLGMSIVPEGRWWL